MREVRRYFNCPRRQAAAGGFKEQKLMEIDSKTSDTDGTWREMWVGGVPCLRLVALGEKD